VTDHCFLISKRTMRFLLCLCLRNGRRGFWAGHRLKHWEVQISEGGATWEIRLRTSSVRWRSLWSDRTPDCQFKARKVFSTRRTFDLHQLAADLPHEVVTGTSHWAHMDKPEDSIASWTSFSSQKRFSK